MPSFSNIHDLMKHVKKVTRYPMEQVAYKVEEILKDYIMREWYSRMEPLDYSRTYEFINSLTISPTKEISDGWNIEIYFDPSKIHAMPADEDRSWNKHMSVSGEDVSENIMFYIEYGNNSPLYKYEGIHMVKNTIEYCKTNKIPIKEMINELRKHGFQVK